MIAAKICIKVECDVNYKTVLLDYSSLLSFILYELIILIYAHKNTKKKKKKKKKKKSYFHYKSLKLQDCKFLVHIFFLTSLAIVLLKISVSQLNSYVFYCFMNFLYMYFFVFSTFCFLLFFAERFSGRHACTKSYVTL